MSKSNWHFWLTFFICVSLSLTLVQSASAYTVEANHPRLFFNENTIATLRTKCISAESTMYDAYVSYVDANVKGDSYPVATADLTGNNIIALSFVYAVDQDTTYLHQAVLAAQSLFDDWTASWYNSPPAQKGLSMLYDWCYDGLGATRTTLYGDSLAVALSREHGSVNYSTNVLHSQPVVIEPMVYMALAIDGDGFDDATATAALDSCFNHMFSDYYVSATLDSAGRDGGHYEGDYTEAILGERHSVAVWQFDYGTDYPAFADSVSSNMTGYGNYLLYDTFPRTSVTGSGAMGGSKQADSEAHAGSRESRMQVIMRLATAYNDSTLIWLDDQYETHTAGMSNSDEYWRYLVTKDTVMGLAAPTTGRGYPAAKKFDIGTVFMREGWDLATTSTDVWAVYRHEQYPFGHAHADAGHFIVGRGNDLLLIDSGEYCGQVHASWFNYFAQTIAHNAITIKLFGETFGGAENSGGQDLGMLLGFDAMCGSVGAYADSLAGRAYRGKIVDYEHNAGDLTYIRSDLTDAYRATKVDTVRREFVWLEDKDAFLVFDYADVDSTGFLQKSLFHTISAPADTAGVWTVIEDNSKMRIQFFGEASSDTIGGIGDEFEVNGTNYPPVGSHTDNGAWRIEALTPRDAEQRWLLTVIEVVADGTAFATVESLAIGDYIGAVVDGDTVLFHKYGGDYKTSAEGEAPASDYTLSITVTDAVTGDTLAARCHVTDGGATVCYPGTAEEAIAHDAKATGTIHWDAHWYSDGTDDITVEEGNVIVGAAHGPEYTAYHDTVSVTGNTNLGIELTAIEDMNALGWYSFDNHTHIYHSPLDYTLIPTNAREIGEAEGLNVINCLDNGYYFSAAVDTYSTSTMLVWMNEEMRHRKWGHMEIIATDALIDSVRYTTFWYPMLYNRADAVHAAGGLFVPAHIHSQLSLTQVDGNELAKELPIGVWKDKYDAVSVASFSSVSTGGRDWERWYHLLNCGFEVPPTVGTDAVANWTDGKPIGGFRAYTYLGATPFAYPAWMAAVQAGNTFVTNGPLFKSFTLGGVSTGGTKALTPWRPAELTGAFEVESTTELLRAYVIVNGEVDQTLDFSGASEMDTTFQVTLNQPSWVAVKVMGNKGDWSAVGDSLWAHTGAVYVTMNGAMPVVSASCDYFSAWIDTLETEATDHGAWKSDPADETTVMAVLDSADTYFEGLYASRGIYSVGTGGDFETLAAGVAGTSAGDTLMLLPGKHTTTDLTIDDRTIRGPTLDAADATIINTSATQQVLKVASGTAILRNLTLRVTSVDMTGAGAFFIYQTGGDLICNNVRWANVTGTGANANDVCLYVTTAATATRLFNCVVDSCSNPMANEENLMHVTDVSVTVIDGCIVSNNVSGDPAIWIHNTVAQDTAIVTGSLFVDNRTIEEGGALRWSPAASTQKAVTYCTFYGNECADVDDGQFYSDDAAGKALNHCVFSHGDSTYALLGNWTTIEHCDAYGNARDAFGPHGVSFDDTIHVDPDYNCLDITRTCYAADAAGAAVCGDGSYMGWLAGTAPGGAAAVSGGHKRDPSRRRR